VIHGLPKPSSIVAVGLQGQADRRQAGTRLGEGSPVVAGWQVLNLLLDGEGLMMISACNHLG
jgi:hypothetical protein